MGGTATGLTWDQEQVWTVIDMPSVGRNYPLGIADGNIMYMKNTALASKDKDRNTPWAGLQPEMACILGSVCL